MQKEGIPLHWAKKPQIIYELVKLGCYTEAVNFDNETALYVLCND